MPISTKVETITPKMAVEILENKNIHNRNLSEATVQEYANDMVNKRWVVTHQGIAFDENGNLNDGQHRLWACVFANVPFETLVTRGIPVQEVRNGVILKPMDSIDRGRVRSVGTQFGLSHGIKNGNVAAACVMGIVKILAMPATHKGKLSTANSLYIYELYGESVSAIVESLANHRRKSHITSPLALYHKAEPLKALELCHQLSTLENLTAPTRAWMRYLDTIHRTEETDRGMRAAATCIKAYHDQKDIKNISDSQDGIKFICSFFPQLNDKIRKAVKPLPGSLVIKKRAMKV